MRVMQWKVVAGVIMLAGLLAGGYQLAGAQGAGSARGEKMAAKSETGYALKKPVFGGACATCPWGAMAEIVKKALSYYGWDVQICYSCAGGPREARLVAAAAMPPKPGPNSIEPPPPNGPIDFGSTGSQYLWWAYTAKNDFAKDPEGPRKQLRLVANIQEPSYYIVAVKADTGITDLHQIVEKRMPVNIMASTGVGGIMTAEVLNYYGLTKENLEPFGAKLNAGPAAEQRKNAQVIIGWGALENAPEYNMWYDVSQRDDLKYLQLSDDLLDHLAKQYDLIRTDVPLGLLRGVDKPVPTVARTGNVIYGRTDMPDDFAYTLAKALDEHQDLLQWANSGMNFSYNWHTVWKAFDVPLHPGAARYYKERGYMK
jgi:uncharacterized protein